MRRAVEPARSAVARQRAEPDPSSDGSEPSRLEDVLVVVAGAVVTALVLSEVYRKHVRGRQESTEATGLAR